MDSNPQNSQQNYDYEHGNGKAHSEIVINALARSQDNYDQLNKVALQALQNSVNLANKVQTNSAENDNIATKMLFNQSIGLNKQVLDNDDYQKYAGKQILDNDEQIAMFTKQILDNDDFKQAFNTLVVEILKKNS